MSIKLIILFLISNIEEKNTWLFPIAGLIGLDEAIAKIKRDEIEVFDSFDEFKTAMAR